MIDNPDNPGSVPPAEMVACPGCQRSSPANRLRCIYCGEELELSESQKRQVKPVLKAVEIWEPAVNIIFLPGKTDQDGSASEIVSDVAGLDAEDALAIIGAGEAVPLARASSDQEAELVAARLSDAGIRTALIADEQLGLKEPPARLRGIEFSESGFRPVLFNDPRRQHDLFSPALIVFGFINRKRLESTEKKSGTGDKILESAETGDDETVLDVYGPSDLSGFRIRFDGFDFSCLGESKAFTAAENIKILADLLRDSYPEAVFAAGYRKLRAVLGIVWPQAHTTSAEGVERRSFGGYAKRKSAVTDNEEQFTRYSRMRSILLNSEA